jgi:hypothetical protein
MNEFSRVEIGGNETNVDECDRSFAKLKGACGHAHAK